MHVEPRLVYDKINVSWRIVRRHRGSQLSELIRSMFAPNFFGVAPPDSPLPISFAKSVERR